MGLFWLQKKQKQKWLEEVMMIEQSLHANATEQNTVDTQHIDLSSLSAKKTIEKSFDSLTFQLVESEINANSHVKKEYQSNNYIPRSRYDDIQRDIDAEPVSQVASPTTPKELETITLQEATRFVHRPNFDEVASSTHEYAYSQQNHQTLDTINPDDPSIRRVRYQTQQETERLLQHQENVVTPVPVENVQLPENNTIKTIDIEEIQSNLQRQRDARQKLARIHPTHAESVQATLDEIRADDIWANLRNTNIPAMRRRHKSVGQAISATQNATNIVSQRMQPQANRYISNNNEHSGVTLSKPVEVPPANTNVQHVNISNPVVVPQREPVQSNFATVNEEPEESYSFIQQEKTTETSTLDDLAEKDVLTEADFAAYYNSQDNHSDFEFNDFNHDYCNSIQAASEYTVEEDTSQSETKQPSWAGTWLSNNHHQGSQQSSYQLPPLSLLLPAEHNPEAVQSAETLLENSITIEEKLAEYRVKVKVLDAYAGPVITRYEIEPDVGVRGNSVINLEKDLARSLGVAAIRVVETIPGKTCMGLELPNPKRQMIRISEVFNSQAFANSTSKLTLALGQDITGEPVVTDLAKAPHLLVAGTTGSGKSVGVNSMILSMLFKASPDDVRMIMIDPKMLELSIYEGIPHLLAPVVTDMKLAANALNWCVNEMEKRYRLMSHVGVRNLAGYNQKIREAAARGQKIANPFSFTPDDPEPLEKLPFIVVIVDEFADLMMTAGKQIEQLIARLAQKARAAGIHLILATQRPSVDVITGLIKANIPTRIAFQVSTKIDSRTILDQMGAENLLGQGDMLFLPPGTGYPKRVHGAFVADSEVHQLVEYLKQFGEPDYIDDILAPEQEEFNFSGSSNDDKDPLFDQAVEFVLRTEKTSISALQRQMRIGYNKAATIVEQMEVEGILSSPDHAGRRQILARTSNTSSD